MLLTPQSSTNQWQPGDAKVPALEYEFKSPGGDAEAFVDFLPTFRIYPGTKLRVAISVDGQAPKVLEVPGSSGTENENGPVRSAAVQDNFARLRVPLESLAAGEHVLTIRAVDAGVAIDRVSLP
jgi:Gylcosyl hydrolase family 115 C-terminal domain